jgi:hypothetical protein
MLIVPDPVPASATMASTLTEIVVLLARLYRADFMVNVGGAAPDEEATILGE